MSLRHSNIAISAILAGLLAAAPVAVAEAAQPDDEDEGPAPQPTPSGDGDPGPSGDPGGAARPAPYHVDLSQDDFYRAR